MPKFLWKETFFQYTLIFTTLVLFGISSCSADSSNLYNGEWDLPAKSVAGLCYIVRNNLPPQTALPKLNRSTYLREGECWKYRWNPCVDVDSREEYIGPNSRRPCGYYQMVAASLHECD